MAVTICEVAPRFGSLPEQHELFAAVRRVSDDATALAARLAERERTYAAARHGVVVPPRVLWVRRGVTARDRRRGPGA